MEIGKWKMAQTWRHFKRPASSKGLWKQFVDDSKERDQMSQGGTPQLVQPGPGRQGYADKRKSPTKINEDLFKQIDDLIADAAKVGKVLDKKALGEGLGYKVVEKGKTSGQGGLNKVIEAWEESRDTVFEYKPSKLTLDSPQVKEVLKLQEEGISTRQITKKLGYKDEKAVRNIFKQFRPDAIKDPNVPGEITSAKQSKKNALENIKIAQKKAGIKTTEQADLVIDKILSQNEIYQQMSVEDIAKDKDFLKRLRVQIDSATGDVTFDGYTKKSPVRGKVFTDLELAQHAKDKAMKYELFAPDHITPKALRRQNVGYPINFQPATYMENSHLDNARKYLEKNPDSNWKPIDNYLSSKNLTIRFGDKKYGFKLPIVFDSKTGTSNIVELSFKKTVPKFKPKISGGPALHSFPANLLPMWKKMGAVPRKALGWFGADIGFYYLDKWNEMSKGKSEKEAAGIALDNATLGAYNNKTYIEGLKKSAKEMGIDSRAFENVYKINEKMGKVQKEHQRYQGMIEKLEGMEAGPEKDARLEQITNAYNNWQESMDPEIDKWVQGVVDDISISKTGGIASPLELSKAAGSITEEEWQKPFIDIQNVALGKLEKEKAAAYDMQSKQVNPEAGNIGDWLLTNVFTTDARGKVKEQERIDDMLDFDPKELYRYNIARGLDPDAPITWEAYNTLKSAHPGLGFSGAQGGIASLKK